MTALRIPARVLQEAGDFLEGRGSYGFEGTAMIAGRSAELAERIVIPDQVAGDEGAWVEVTDKGKLELAAALRDGSIYVSRIHSHALSAFHSKIDDRNPILTYEGALSIVVPFFGLGLRHGLDACAVFQLQRGKWIEIPAGRLRDKVVIEIG